MYQNGLRRWGPHGGGHYGLYVVDGYGNVTYHNSMGGQMIGIKLADRSFFPIVEEDNPGRQRVVLTASRDHQDRVDIVLYRAIAAPTGTHQRIGDLSFFNLPDRDARASEFELVVGVDEQGHIDARVTDLVSGDSRDLAVDLDDLPFDLDDHSITETQNAPVLLEEPPRRRRSWIIPVILLVLALIAAGLWFFLLRDDATAPVGEEESAPPVTTEEAPALPEAETSEQVTPESPSDAGEQVVTPEQSVPEQIEETAEPEAITTSVEVPYEIIRGDTLWDISIHFYGTPWRFREIAERNAIGNPDLIYADDDIVIPTDR